MNHIIRCIAALLLCGIAQADVIVDWNTRADAIATEKRLTAPLYGRSLAMMHVAMFEALNAIDRRYQSYRLNLVADRNTSREAAAAIAAHDVLTALYPDQQAALDATRRSQIGSGERAEKIRTYNFPENRVTDHRIKLTLHRLDQVLDGDLNEVTEALRAEEQRQALAAASA